MTTKTESMAGSMNKGAPLLLCGDAREALRMRSILGNTMRIYYMGQGLHGLRASCLLVTENVDRRSDWFRMQALTRLIPNAPVLSVEAPPV